MVGRSVISRIPVAGVTVLFTLLASCYFEWEYIQFDSHVNDRHDTIGSVGMDLGCLVCQVRESNGDYSDSLLVEFTSIFIKLVWIITTILLCCDAGRYT